MPVVPGFCGSSTVGQFGSGLFQLTSIVVSPGSIILSIVAVFVHEQPEQ